MKPATKEYLPVIDVLRFFAASFIMLLHYGFRSWKVNGESLVEYPELLDFHVLQYAPLLVQLFLLISGFVIPLSAEGKTAGDFARSRVVRLYPVFWICCTVTFIVTHFWGPAAVQSGLTVYATNMTMLHGFLHLPNIDAVYWTLTVEMRFYGFIFLILFLRRYHQMIWFMTLWLAISLTDQVHLLPRGDSFFATPYAPYFVAGFLFSEWFRSRLTPFSAWILTVALCMGVGRALDFFAHDSALTGVPTHPAAVIGILLSFYLLFVLISTHRLRLDRLAKWTTVLGGISYPLFLLHNFAGITLIQILAPYLNRWLNLVIVCSLSILSAWLIWRYLEKPSAKFLKRILPGGK